MADSVPHGEIRKFLCPELVSGPGCLDLAGRYARNLGLRHALLVSDAGVTGVGWPAEVAASLRAEDVSFDVFDRISPNPRAEEVMAGAAAYVAAGCDGLVVVGGGSPLDAAKGIGIVVANGQDIRRYEGVDTIGAPIPPLVCIPTTAGSAADVSQFAIISDRQRRVKFAIISKALIPDVSLIDPRTFRTMPPAITAATGMDTLTHAFEAYVSNASSRLTDMLALEAVRAISAALPRRLQEPGDEAAAAETGRACMLAGMAFSNAILGAVHALAHSLGGLLDAPHGACNALLLEHVIRANFGGAPGRYRALAEAMGVRVAGLPDPEAREALAGAVARLRQEVGLGGSLRQLGVRPEDLPGVAANAVHDPCMATNPLPLAQGELEALLERAL